MQRKYAATGLRSSTSAAAPAAASGHERHSHPPPAKALERLWKAYPWLVTRMPAALWIADVGDGALYLSPNVEAITGYAQNEFCAGGRAQWLKRVHPEDRPGVRRAYAALRRDGTLFTIEYRFFSKDGLWLWLHDEAVKPAYLHVIPYDFGLFWDITRAREEIERCRRELRERELQLEGARESERRRISREIHDELGAALTLVKVDLAHVEDSASTDAERRAAHSLGRRLDEACGALRRIATALRPSILDTLGIIAAIEWLSENLQERMGIACVLENLCPREPELDDARATALFRIVQEALTNVLKHSNATQVHIVVRCDHASIMVHVRDDGTGFDVAQARAGGHTLGLASMSEGASAYGGTTAVTSTPRGTVVSVVLPLVDREGSPP
ncbi:MAG TPA: PAS domain-containing protein [Burkholderiales bacterium]|nr:PAS domain-containing protein [Burkholderiales bacterium]